MSECQGCSSPAVVRGFCNRHYLRARRAGELEAHTPLWRELVDVLELEGSHRTAELVARLGRHPDSVRRALGRARAAGRIDRVLVPNWRGSGFPEARWYALDQTT